MNYYTVTSFWSAKPLLHYSTSNHIAKKKPKKKKNYFSLLSIKKTIIENTVNIVRSTNNEIKNDSFDSEALSMQSQHLLV